MSGPSTALPADLLTAAVARAGAAPLVTSYDDATGDRVELSAVTLANWVAKTANLLVDGLGAQPGDRVVMVLPPHWQTAVWLMACWSAGVVAEPLEPGVEPDPDAGPYFLAVAEEVLDMPEVSGGLAAGADEVVGLSL
ncbi:MAG: TIGR03089 family protein, partial [Actinomycetes bacterium]